MMNPSPVRGHRSRVALLLGAALLSAALWLLPGCGKYGPPQRRPQQPPPAAAPEPAPEPADAEESS